MSTSTTILSLAKVLFLLGFVKSFPKAGFMKNQIEVLILRFWFFQAGWQYIPSHRI